VRTAFGTKVDLLDALALQPDGKIVAGGEAWTGSKFEFALTRYNQDGSLDSAFGSGGKVTTAFGSVSGASITTLLLQGDGKIVALGHNYNGSNEDFALARYKADGSLDSTFGSGGKTTAAIGSGDDRIYAGALQPDGKIVVAGSSVGATTFRDFVVARFNANGTPDSSFGSGGHVVTDFDSGYDDAYDLLLQPDGKLVAVGTAENAAGIRDFFALARYLGNGSLDTSFGSGGKVTTAVGASYDEARAAALQPDGKIVAGGDSYMGSRNIFALARYNGNGSLDQSFASGGKLTTVVGTDLESVLDLALQPDGKVLAAGYADPGSGGGSDFALVRYNADGSLDQGFGAGGKVIAGLSSRSDTARAMVLQPDGKIVLGGLYVHPENTSDWDFELARFLGNSLAVTKAGSGSGTVTSSPSGIDCGSTCSAPFAAVPVTLTATPAAGSTFTGWAGDCSGTGSCTVTMSADRSVTATFEADKTLTVNLAGSGTGTVVSSPPGIDCPSTCAHAFTHGTSVTLTATSSSRSRFAGWSGDCSGTGTCTLSMTAARTATARFNVACVVPKVKGKKLAAAKRRIKAAHCAVGKIKRAYSSKVRKGRVISQRPRPGKKLVARSKVRLKVSKGKRP
jgi:uncharacterized delta-60 repeat protein